MKLQQGQNSDILSMLSGKAGSLASAKGAKASSEVSGEGLDILSLLGSSQASGDKAEALSKSEFAEILSQKGMLEDISAEDILNFFKKSQGENAEEAVSGLLQNYAQVTGKNIDIESLPKEIQSELNTLSFDGKDFKNIQGDIVPKDSVLKLLSKIENNDIPSDQEFSRMGELKEGKGLRLADEGIKNTKPVLPKHDSSDFLAHRMAAGKQTVVNPTAEVVRPKALSQYGKEASQLKDSLIKVNRPSLSEVKTPEKVTAKDSLQDLMKSVSHEVQPEMMGMERVSENTNSSEFNMNKGQGVQSLDLSNISASNKTELLQKVGNYIEQSYVSGQDSIEMMINHEELGQFRVQVEKVGNNGQVNLEINTLSNQGHQFFAENEVELLKSLNQSGVKLNDFKLAPQVDFLSMGDTSKSSMNSDSSSSFLGGHDRGEASSFTQSGKQGDNRGEDRRRQLWQEARSFSEQMYA